MAAATGCEATARLSVRALAARFEVPQSPCSSPDSPRELWSLEEATAAAAASAELRTSRREQVLKRFGCRKFTQPKDESPGALRQALGLSEYVKLSPQDCALRSWGPYPVLLSETSNAFALNWVLKGHSGAVGIASSLATCWLLGAGLTIFCSDADAVQASRVETGVRLAWVDNGGRLTLRMAEAVVADEIVQTINSRAAARAALRLQQQMPEASS